MEITQIQATPVPEWMSDVLTKLKGNIDQATQFVCKTTRPEFGTSPNDDLISVQIGGSESIKTTLFETDGQWEDYGHTVYADGWVKHRRVRDWNYVLIENAIHGGTLEARSVRTLYVRDKRLFLELRRAVGLPGY